MASTQETTALQRVWSVTDRIEQLLELILTEVIELKKGQARLETEVAELKKGQARLEVEVTELKRGQFRLEANQERLEANQEELKKELKELREKAAGLKRETMLIDEKLDKLLKQEKEFQSYRRFSQEAISDLQLRQEHLQEEVQQIRKVLNLDKAS